MAESHRGEIERSGTNICSSRSDFPILDKIFSVQNRKLITIIVKLLKENNERFMVQTEGKKVFEPMLFVDLLNAKDKSAFITKFNKKFNTNLILQDSYSMKVTLDQKGIEFYKFFMTCLDPPDDIYRFFVKPILWKSSKNMLCEIMNKMIQMKSSVVPSYPFSPNYPPVRCPPKETDVLAISKKDLKLLEAGRVDLSDLIEKDGIYIGTEEEDPSLKRSISLAKNRSSRSSGRSSGSTDLYSDDDDEIPDWEELRKSLRSGGYLNGFGKSQRSRRKRSKRKSKRSKRRSKKRA